MKYINKYSDNFEQLNYMHSLNAEEKIEALNEIIAYSNKVMFFGGAGVSTESGIPDFRSKNGLYNQHDIRFDKYEPEYLLSHDCLENEPEVFYEFYRQKMDIRNIEPNKAHFKLSELENKKKIFGIITQNIDGLHQKAGSENVYEIHGTTRINYCNKCGRQYDANYIFESTEKIPRCVCGGKIRPDVTLYGENLPNAFAEASRAICDADCLIVGGTSLSVFPAAFIVPQFQGKYLIIINHDPTEYDKYADLVFHENIGDVMEKIEY